MAGKQTADLQKLWRARIRNKSAVKKNFFKHRLCVCLYTFMFVSLILFMTIRLSICFILSLYICLSVVLSTCHLVCLSLYLSVCLSLSVYMSVCLCICLSVCLYLCICVWKAERGQEGSNLCFLQAAQAIYFSTGGRKRESRDSRRVSQYVFYTRYTVQLPI